MRWVGWSIERNRNGEGSHGRGRGGGWIEELTRYYLPSRTFFAADSQCLGGAGGELTAAEGGNRGGGGLGEPKRDAKSLSSHPSESGDKVEKPGGPKVEKEEEEEEEAKEGRIRLVEGRGWDCLI